MENEFKIRENVLYAYYGTEKNVVIPNGVQRIYEKAFRFSDIESVVIPETVETIEYEAFQFCKNLVRVEIPKSVNFISVTAFEFCNKLETIIIDNDNPNYAASGAIIIDKEHNTVVD